MCEVKVAEADVGVAELDGRGRTAMHAQVRRAAFRVWLLSLAVVGCESRPQAREAERGAGGQTRVAPDTSSPAPGQDTPLDTSRGPEEVVRAYYDAINAHDYQRAYAAWGDDGPPGRPTVRAFASGFAGTDSVHVVLGAPGRIEGAAGSRYMTIPVRVRAFEHGAGPREFAGSYTVRRSVVPGSDTASRQWHLYAASLH